MKASRKARVARQAMSRRMFGGARTSPARRCRCFRGGEGVARRGVGGDDELEVFEGGLAHAGRPFDGVAGAAPWRPFGENLGGSVRGARASAQAATRAG